MIDDRCERGHKVNGLNVYKRSGKKTSYCRLCQLARTRVIYAKRRNKNLTMEDAINQIAEENRTIAVYAGL